ncbi:hypothetical protein BDF19DRAFT_439423 [Syncephalis fuscata]|nr:hypothetical protein BDF19DRAFT_439423 [Syncephalis fuscata]
MSRCSKIGSLVCNKLLMARQLTVYAAALKAVATSTYNVVEYSYVYNWTYIHYYFAVLCQVRVQYYV